MEFVRVVLIMTISRSFAVATNLFWASVLSLTFPRILGAFGSVGGEPAAFISSSHLIINDLAFGFYAALNVVAFVMIFFLLPGNADCSA